MTMPSDEERFLYGKAEKHKKRRLSAKMNKQKNAPKENFIFELATFFLAFI